MRDIYHNLFIQQVLAPVTATASQTSSAIDLQGFNAVNVLFSVGNSGDTLSGSLKWTLTLQESDNNSDYTEVAASSLHNAASSVVVDAPTEDTTAIIFGYKGTKRYLKGVATATGSHSNGTPMAITAILGDASQVPVA